MIDEKRIQPCPQCKSESIEFYRLIKYRPKEFYVKCASCGFFVYGKGSHLHILERAWNKRALAALPKESK